MQDQGCLITIRAFELISWLLHFQGSYSSSITSETSSVRTSRRSSARERRSPSVFPASKALSFESGSEEEEDDGEEEGGEEQSSLESVPVYGPTTRRQWMEQVTKPRSPSRSNSNKENNEVREIHLYKLIR